MVYFLILISLTIISVFFTISFYIYSQKLKKKEKDVEHKLFELSVIKELDERISYSLNIQKIIDVIIGSLKQLIDYTTVSYLLFEQEKLIFKCYLEESVTQKFILSIKDKMLSYLSAETNRDLKKNKIEETITGAIIIEGMDISVHSFFNIPIIIKEKTIGVINIASNKKAIYKKEEISLLEKITAQASRAIIKLEEILSIEQEKINAMVESIVDGLIMVDKNYKILTANPIIKNILQFKKQDISIFDLIDTLSGIIDIKGKLEETIDLEKVIKQENVFLNDRFYEIILAPVKSNLFPGENKILGAVIIFHDITRERELEKVRQDFTHMIVHELRSPLDGIKKMSEVLLDKNSKIAKKERREFFSLIVKNSNDMLILVNDLLDAAKIEAGKFQIIKQEVNNIGSLILDKAKYFKSQFDLEKIQLQIKIANNLPKISIDSLRISQILNNLIGNAIKYTEKGGKIQIGAFVHQENKNILQEAAKAGLAWIVPVQMTENNNYQQEQNSLPLSIIISVTDSGIGIAPGEQELLFNKYKQLKASIESGKRGSGLGLIIAKGIIESHGGKIFVLSEQSEGSTFYFNLPIDSAQFS